MKKILIIFAPISQVHLVERLRNEMRQKGFDIDAFNSNNWQSIDGKVYLPGIYRNIRPLLAYRITRAIIMRTMLKCLLLKLSSEYDLVDVHFFAREYIGLLNKLKKPFKISVWGSDFYRMSCAESEGKRLCFERAKLIQCETPTVRKDLIKYQPSLEGKIRVCNFGIDIIDDIDRIDKHGWTKAYPNKVVITCGYNGSVGQQHLKMIEAIQKLPTELKNRIIAYFPLTYGLTASYRSRLTEALATVDYEYKLFEKRLTDEELAMLRLETDIALNVQITDSLSSSLLQHLYAGSVVLVGDWLPYEIYDENGIFYKSTSLQSISTKLIDCIKHINEYKAETKNNREIIRQMSAWNEVAKKQANIYQELIEIA